MAGRLLRRQVVCRGGKLPVVTLVVSRQARAYAAFCGQLPRRLALLRSGRGLAKGALERIKGYLETNCEPGRRFANHLDFQADRMSTASHLFRAMNAPAAAKALPKLAERAWAEDWSYERFAQALLATETSTRAAHGGKARIKARWASARSATYSVAVLNSTRCPARQARIDSAIARCVLPVPGE